MSYLSAFTNQMEAFGQELCSLFPTDNTLGISLNMIRLLKRTNPRQLLSVFHNFADPYKVLILNKDESFLLNHNYTDLAQKGGNLSYAESIITQLKEHWGDMSDENKQIIWKYFYVLFKLGEKIKS